MWPAWRCRRWPAAGPRCVRWPTPMTPPMRCAQRPALMTQPMRRGRGLRVMSQERLSYMVHRATLPCQVPARDVTEKCRVPALNQQMESAVRSIAIRGQMIGIGRSIRLQSSNTVDKSSSMAVSRSWMCTASPWVGHTHVAMCLSCFPIDRKVGLSEHYRSG